MQDLRLTKRLTDYWNRIRRDQPLPSWELFNVAAIEDIWGQCCLWRVDIGDQDRNINQYTYEYVGSNAKEALGKDLTGMVFGSHLQRFPGARVVERIDEVVQEGQLVMDEGTFVNEHNKVVKYRSCLLPFGNKKGRITHIVLGLSWRAF